MQDIFPSIIGQEAAKKRLSFYVENYASSRFVPNMLFIAPRGCGKTTLAKALAKNLVSFEKDSVEPKDYIEINCGQIRNLKHFLTVIITRYVHDKEVTLLFDEASELPQDVQMGLLTMVNPNSEMMNEFFFEDSSFLFNFKRQTFLFATTEAHKLFPALVDRLTRIDLAEYSSSELARILQLKSPTVKYEDGLPMTISSVLRGNGRQAQLMANDIVTYTKGKGVSEFSNNDWSIFKDRLNIAPLGLSAIELQVLKILNAEGPCTLTNLSAKTLLSKECLQRDIEMVLLKLGLLSITTAGRMITVKGRSYLKNLTF